MEGLLVVFNMLGNTLDQMQAKMAQMEREIESLRAVVASLREQEPAE